MVTPSDKIYLTKSTIAGRGIFAKVPIQEGELIESCPVIVVPLNERSLVNPDLRRFIFAWDIAGQKTVAVVMGFGSFYNHSEHPNAIYQPSILHRVMNFVAIREIKKDEEIFTNYGYEIKPEDIRENNVEI